MPGEDVMEVTGKNNKIFISSDTLFQNSKCLFVEYDDIIKSPQFILLQFIKEIDAIKNIFDLSEIEGKELEEMYEWYLLRQYKNIFLNFPVDKDTYASAFHNDNEIYYQFCDELLKTQLNKIPECFSADAILNFSGTLQKLTWDGLLVKKVIVYCEYGFEHAKDDIEKRQMIGTSAQKLKEIYPELVSESEDGKLAVSYEKLSIIALAAIDKLYKENEELKDRLKRIEEKLGL